MSNLTPTALFIAASSKSLINFRFDLMVAVRQQYKVQVYALAPQDKDFAAVKQCLAQAEIILIALNLNNTGLNVFKDLGCFINLYKIVRKLNPMIMMMAAVKPIIYGLMVGWLLHVKCRIVLMTGLGHLYTVQDRKTKLLRVISNTLYRVTLPLAHHVFFQNKDDQQLFLDLNLTTINQSTLTPGSGVNLNQFPHTPASSNQFTTFLFIGRLLKAKGIEEYCQAAGRIKAHYPNTVFQVLGGFHSNPNSTGHHGLQQLFLENGIDYLGEQPSTLAYLQAAHVIVLPSYYREGVPKSLLEALSVGRAIITTDAPGCRETVIDGNNGYLVSPQNVDDLQNAMVKILENPDQVQRMGHASRQLAKTRFDVHIVNQLVTQKIVL